MENKIKPEISEIDELKLIYYEILAGSSFDAELKLYVKHFSEKESHLILKKRIELFNYYIKEGVPDELTLLKNALETGEWTKEKEDKILELKFLISDNEKNIHNIIIQQRKGIEAIIEAKKKELSEILWDRKNILGRHVEDLIDDDINDYVSYLSLFKDEECKTPIIDSYQEFEKIEISDLNRLDKAINRQYLRISNEKIRQIACMPFFLNRFSYSKEDIASFLGKSIIHQTHYQNHIFSLGVRNLNILSQAEGNPPDLNLEATPQDVLKWYDIQNSILIGKRNSQKEV